MLKNLVRALLLVLSALACLPAFSAELNPELLQQWQRLSPEQRAQLLRSAQQQSGSGQAPPPLAQPEVVTPRARADDAKLSPIEARYANRVTPERLLRSKPPEPQADDRREVTRAAEAIKPSNTDAREAAPQADRERQQEDKPQPEADRDPRLRQFGYDLFAGAPTTFAPATDIPVPADYVIGPGDTVQIQFFGKENTQHQLVVTREGLLQLPGIGPVSVAGLKFAELKKTLEQRIARQMIGMQASIAMGALRSIRIFVLGDANRPGSYTVSALSTMTNALFVSGGVKPIGSLRNIQLKRNGRVVTTLDLYDLLLKGDTSGDARLQPGDVIFIPPIGATVAVDGEVRRPAIYELRHDRRVQDALDFAGNSLPTAYPQASQLERINKNGDRTVVDVDLSEERDLQQPLADGDVLRVYSILERMDELVLLSGHVARPGGYQWREGMRVADLVPSAHVLLPKPDLEYALIRRELGPRRTVKVLAVRLGKAIAEPSSPANPPLARRDQVFVFAMSGDRQAQIASVLDELRQQADSDNPVPIVAVSGLVRESGSYPLVEGMRVSDLIRAGGQLREAAYTLAAEITRYDSVNGEYRTVEHIPVNLSAALAGDEKADLRLRPHDNLHVKQLPRWSEQQVIELHGQVRFPGAYPIKRGETLRAVIERAGGLTDIAFPQGAVFTREELRAREQQQLEALAMRLESDLAAMSLEQIQAKPETQQAYGAARSLLSQLKTTKATGRLVIDLNEALSGERSADVVLKDGDKLYIPKQTQEVTVIGEVQHPTSHFYTDDLSRNDYIQRSGGTTYKADKKRIYIVRANGEVVVGKSGFGWFGNSSVRPGDTIVVPLDADRVKPLTLWTNVTQIIYQLGIAAAAFNAVGLF